MDDNGIDTLMRDVIAFVMVRYKDDMEGGKTILDGMEHPVDMLLGMTDFAISLVKMTAHILGIPEKMFIETLGQQSVLLEGRG